MERAPAGRTEGAAQVDRDLVEAARSGDREAYADLIRMRGDRLYAIAQRILRDVHRTEDAVQDALVIAWRDLPGLRDPDRFDAWLGRILVRTCIAVASRDRRRLTVDIQALRSDAENGLADAVASANHAMREIATINSQLAHSSASDAASFA